MHVKVHRRYHEAVEPILRRHFPDLGCAAARIGSGSDVLGFDDQRSTDHLWGPLLNLFLSEDDRAGWGKQIEQVLGDELPFEARGYSTHFRPFEGNEAHLGGLGHITPRQERPVKHGVMLNCVQSYFPGYLGTPGLRSRSRPDLEGTLAATNWQAREKHLVRANEHVAVMHNALRVSEPVPETVASFHGRPFLVIHADRFAEAAERAIYQL